MKYFKLRYCQKQQEEIIKDGIEPVLVDPADGLGNFVQIIITQLHVGVPTSPDAETESDNQSEEILS